MTKKARWILGSGAVLAALVGGAVVALPPLLFGDGHDYSQVASIEGDRRYQDPALLAKAFALPVAAAYAQGGVDYQRNGSFCGPTTAVNVQRSRGVAASQDSILEGTGIATVFGGVWGGLTLDEEADLLRRKTGREVTVLRDLDRAAFRREVTQANDPSLRYTINFHRGPLFGRGGGHHSPIAGYLEEEDLVLVLDVNERYKPFLVATDRLFEAVDTVDPRSGARRGLLRVQD